jgi:hypothetical protein
VHEAYTALGQAYDKLREAQPNARDYYVQGDNAYREATLEHVERLKKIEAVRSDMLTIHECIFEGRIENWDK